MYNNDTPLTITLKPGAKKKFPNYLPTKPTTIRKLMHECIDYNCIPKKLLLVSLIPYTENVTHKRFLSIVSSHEGTEEYHHMFIVKKYTFIQLMYEMGTCNPPINLLLEHLPRLMPRPYTIASSQLDAPNQLKIVYTLLNECSSVDRGIVTNALFSSSFEKIVNSQDNEIISYHNYRNDQTYELTNMPIYFRSTNKFRLTDEDCRKNIIMIANGAGISPFLGFIEHRNKLKKINSSIEFGQCWLFYGIRYKLTQHLESFFRQAIENETLSMVAYTSSRDCLLSSVGVDDDDQSSLAKFHVPGKYVQDAIKYNFCTFYNQILCDDTKVFVCGGQNMAKDVENMIINCGNEKDKCFAEKFEAKKKSDMYMVDVWT